MLNKCRAITDSQKRGIHISLPLISADRCRAHRARRALLMAWDTEEEWWISNLFEASAVTCWITVGCPLGSISTEEQWTYLPSCLSVCLLLCQSLLIIISVTSPDFCLAIERLTSPATGLSVQPVSSCADTDDSGSFHSSAEKQAQPTLALHKT